MQLQRKRSARNLRTTRTLLAVAIAVLVSLWLTLSFAFIWLDSSVLDGYKLLRRQREASPSFSVLPTADTVPAVSASTLHNVARGAEGYGNPRGFAFNHEWGSVLFHSANNPYNVSQPHPKAMLSPDVNPAWRTHLSDDTTFTGGVVHLTDFDSTKLSHLSDPKNKPLEGRRILIVTDSLQGTPFATQEYATFFREYALSMAALGAHVDVLHTSLHKVNPSFLRTSTQHYADSSVSLLTLPEQEAEWAFQRSEDPALASCRIARFIQNRSFSLEYDSVHFPDTGGLSYCWSMLKNQTSSLIASKVIVGLFGSRQWLAWNSRDLPASDTELVAHYYERAAVELADELWSPSSYMAGYVMSRYTISRPILAIPALPVLSHRLPPRPASQADSNKGDTSHIEFVYVGAYAMRDGIDEFTAAMQEVRNHDIPDAQLHFTYYGVPHWDSARGDVRSLLESQIQVAAEYNITLKVLTSASAGEVADYLKAVSGRIAVLPAVNGHYSAVLQLCRLHGIPMLAPSSGALLEGFDAAFNARQLVSARARHLTAALARILNGELRVVDLIPPPDTATFEKAVGVFAAMQGSTVAAPLRPGPLGLGQPTRSELSHGEAEHLIDVVHLGCATKIGTNESWASAHSGVKLRTLQCGNQDACDWQDIQHAGEPAQYTLLVNCAVPASDGAISRLLMALLASRSGLASSFSTAVGSEVVQALHPPMFSVLSFAGSVQPYTPVVLLVTSRALSRLVSDEDIVSPSLMLEVVLRSARLTLPYAIIPESLFTRQPPDESVTPKPNALKLAQVYAHANSVVSQAAGGLRLATVLQEHVANPPIHRSWMTYTGTQGYWDVTYGMIVLPPMVIRGPSNSHFPVSIAKYFRERPSLDVGTPSDAACENGRRNGHFDHCSIPAALYNYSAAVYGANGEGWSAWRLADDISAPVPYIENYALHPAVSNQYHVLPVRSWTSHVEAVGRISLFYFIPAQCGDGACLHMIVDQQPIWHTCSLLGFRRVGDYNHIITLHVGTRIDLIVDPLGNHECDMVHVELTVERQPEGTN